MDFEVERWLRAFSRAVRERDYAAGMTLFRADVVAFGTVAERAEGSEVLQARQWRVVWETTRGFEFDYDSLRCERRGDRAWVAAQWSSVGTDRDGCDLHRAGRASLVLAGGESGWQALHSHFSLAPTKSR